MVGSIVMFISSEPYRRLPSWARSSQEVPAKAASQPRIRSSSIACPTDSWICSASCSEPRIRVVSPAGQAGAVSSARASSATRGAWPARSSPVTSSQPRVPYWPRKEGYERRWVSPSPIAVAAIPAPHSRMCWSIRCPSLETSHLRVSQIW